MVSIEKDTITKRKESILSMFSTTEGSTSACGRHATSQEGKLCLIKTTSLSTNKSQLLLLTDSISINRKHIFKEKFGYTQGIIRIRKSMEDRQHMAKRKSTKEQTTIYRTLHSKQTINPATRAPLKTGSKLKCSRRVHF